MKGGCIVLRWVVLDNTKFLPNFTCVILDDPKSSWLDDSKFLPNWDE